MKNSFNEATIIYIELNEHKSNKTFYTIFKNGEILDNGCLTDLDEGERKRFFEKAYGSGVDVVYGLLRG